MIKSVDETNISDAGFVYSVSWKESHKTIVTEEFSNLHTPEYQKTQLIDQINHGKSVFLSYVEKNPAGIVMIDKSKNEIVSLYILPEYFGAGIGKELLDYAKHKLDESKEIVLTVMNVNHRARKFYEKNGFSFSGIETILSSEKNLSELVYTFMK